MGWKVEVRRGEAARASLVVAAKVHQTFAPLSTFAFEPELSGAPLGEGDFVVLAFEATGAAGYLLGSYNRPTAGVWNLGVDESRRSQGIGASLLLAFASVLDPTTEVGLAATALTDDDAPRLVAFYRKCGLAPDPDEAPFEAEPTLIGRMCAPAGTIVAALAEGTTTA